MAADLVEATTGRPRRTDLCRAVSAAYYALFHCLARSCADGLAGQAGTVGNRPMWRRVYRALEHRQTRTRCENVPSSFPDDLQEFGLTFAMLQGRRHLADPDHPFSKSNVIADINNARAMRFGARFGWRVRPGQSLGSRRAGNIGSPEHPDTVLTVFNPATHMPLGTSRALLRARRVSLCSIVRLEPLLGEDTRPRGLISVSVRRRVRHPADGSTRRLR